MAKQNEQLPAVNAGNPLTGGLVLPGEKVAKERFTVMCSEKFKDFNELVSRLNQTAVTNDIQLDTAERTVKEATKYLGDIKKYHDEQKKPFKEIGDVIDTVTKVEYSTVLENAKSAALKQITNYKNLKLAQAAEEKRKADEAARKLQEELEEQRKLVDRRMRMATAKVFGGSYTKNSGEQMTFPMLYTVEECRKAEDMFQNKFPIDGVSDELQTYLRITKDLSVKTLRQMADIFNEGLEIAERISYIKRDYDEEIENIRNRIGIKIEKVVKAEVKSASMAVNAAAKGIIAKIDWTIEDLSKVPVEYLQLNDAAVRAFTQGDNRENVLKQIKDGKGGEIIAGIHFIASTTTRV